MLETGHSEQLAHANLLIIEIGNSHVSVATSIEAEVRTLLRFPHCRLDEAVQTAQQSWQALPDDRVKSTAVCSVVPSLLRTVRNSLADRLDTPLRVVGDDLHRPLSLAVEAPEQVGIDRVCSAAAAYDVIRKACVVAGFGTAITVDCVNDEGVFMGGAILPGIRLQAQSLHEGTAALPCVAVDAADAADTPFGTTTEQAIRAGIIYGVVGALREITERFAGELNAWPQLVATGGQAELIHNHCDFIDSVVPDLCIRGIALAHRRRFSPIEDT
ncbi:MAG: type III pantothenate kinase [Phycisphaerae bacterium]